MDWHDQAAYLAVNPELFFPVGNTRPAFTQIEEAKAICATRTVLDIYLKWALDNSQDSEIWDGASEGKRRALKRRGARQRRASSI